MSSNPYLDALHQQQVDFLNSLATATPEQKAQIQAVANGGSAPPVTQPQQQQPQATPATQSKPTGPAPNVKWDAPVTWNGSEYVDTGTGRPAYYGPNGQPGSGTPFQGAQAWTQPDGKVVYYDPNNFNYGDASRGAASKVDAPGEQKKKDDTDTSSAQGYLTDLLRRYGLDSLAGWAMDQIKAGATQYEIIQALRQRPEYKTRFAGMDQRAAKGLGALSEDEYIAFENTTKDFLQRAGITGYRTPTELANLIGNFANVGQVADRVQKGYQQVAQAPPEVRQEMQKWFGVDGDGALAAFFLDPEKAEPMIIKAAQTAVIGGTGLRQGLDVTQGMAGRLADLGMTNDQIQGGFGQAGLLGDLQYQTIDENSAKAAGLTADTLASGVFGLEGSDSKAIKDRLDTRKAQFDTRGEAGASQKGAFGLGIAQ